MYKKPIQTKFVSTLRQRKNWNFYREVQVNIFKITCVCTMFFKIIIVAYIWHQVGVVKMCVVCTAITETKCYVTESWQGGCINACCLVVCLVSL